ncbi:MAG: hypothetical protein LQ339_008474 [Xanthoria mediterranea]|nr:MAG: hypothetical protein LQ339_008474 [Xanthoria mediterranea]
MPISPTSLPTPLPTANAPILPPATPKSPPHHLSHSTGSGGHHNNNTLTLEPLTKPKHNQTNRGGHESHDTHEPVGGKNWVRLDDGSIAPMPGIHPVEMEESEEHVWTRDEAALNEAIIGVKQVRM